MGKDTPLSYRLGVDIGGTFTDLALYDVVNDLIEFAKTPSTPADQTLGVTNGIRQLVGRLQVRPEEISVWTAAAGGWLERS